MAKREGITPLAEIGLADSRFSTYAITNKKTGQQRPYLLADHYAAIEQYALHDAVPDSIATQFDVARNLYVYAWCEYRFFNVAEANALTVLELAMKERIGDKALKAYIKQRQADHKVKTGNHLRLSYGMKTLMEYCRDNKLVKNEGFSAWQHYPTHKAYQQKKTKQRNWAMAELKRTDKDSIELPDIEIIEYPPDPNYDHVQHLVNHVNKNRNTYAHGTTMLYPNVIHSFEMVSEFINQLFLSAH